MKVIHGLVRLRSVVEARWYGRWQNSYAEDLTFTEAVCRFPERNALYAYMHHYFRHNSHASVRAHRAYFRKNRRGFGEDAFHAMWWLLLREFKPQKCLEVGVFRGQVISLWALMAKKLGFACEVSGISPFTPVGDTVSKYRDDVDYLADTLASFDALNLPPPRLVRALSTAPPAVEHISTNAWDLIYIDGSHDYEIVLADYRLCRNHLKAGGLLVMDDASLNTSFKPPSFSFAGHPGPSRVAAELAMRELKFLGAIGHVNVFRNQCSSPLKSVL